MKPSVALAAHRDAIRQVVESNRACNPRVFGSVLYGEDTDESDLDILIDPTDQTSLFDLGSILHELKVLLGVPVHLATPKGLPAKSRDQILSEAQPV